MLELLRTILGIALPPLQKRRRVRVTMHRAYFTRSGRECYFITVTNISQDREIEVTHAWIDASRQVPAFAPERPLPKRLKPDESWETWIDVAKVPVDCHRDIFKRGRIRLSNGATVKSKLNKDVPEQGYVPGGPGPV